MESDGSLRCDLPGGLCIHTNLLLPAWLAGWLAGKAARICKAKKSLKDGEQAAANALPLKCQTYIYWLMTDVIIVDINIKQRVLPEMEM